MPFRPDCPRLACARALVPRCLWLYARTISPSAFDRRSGRAFHGLEDSMLRRDQPPMSVVHRIFMRMFGRPQGILGRLGGIIMARSNQQCAAWVIDLLDIQPHDSVLEVGFGPGVGIQLLAQAASAGYVAGVGYSGVVVGQGTARDVRGNERGWVGARHGAWRRVACGDNN